MGAEAWSCRIGGLGPGEPSTQPAAWFLNAACQYAQRPAPEKSPSPHQTIPKVPTHPRPHSPTPHPPKQQHPKPPATRAPKLQAPENRTPKPAPRQGPRARP